MPKIICLFLTLCFSTTLFAQTSYQLSGTLKDTLNFGYTQYTSISLLTASDSILITYTRADADGHFALTVDSPARYILLFEHPRFATFVDDVTLTGVDTNLGVIPMISKSSLLQEVVIVGKNAISIKGDTIEYAADSFKTGQYDNVDELLKKLPGLEVNRDGSIKAYGKDVKKMLVDGDEFFSDDPAQVSKMLRASSVQSVQVYDSKSKQAEQTGIEDGEQIKTINLKLKDDAKHGYFGKVLAGGGLPDYWQNEAMINAFKKKRKISAYAIMSNTEQGGLGWQERNDYGSGSNFSFNDDGVVSISSNANNMYGWDGAYNGEGLPKSWQAGTHYSNSWWGDTLSLNGSYSFSKNNAYALNNSVTQYILPDTQYFNYDNSENKRSNLNHNISIRSNYKIDSLSTLDLTLTGSIGQRHSDNFHQSVAKNTEGGLINENQQHQYANGDNQTMGLSLWYNKKFRKKGRSLSATFSENINHATNEGILQSEYHLYAIDSTKNIDQRKVNENDNQNASIGLNYTEPLAEKFFLLFNYHFSHNNQKAHLQSFNRAAGTGGYEDVLDSLYSSQYSYRTLGNRGGINLKYNPNDKINVTLGGDISNTTYTQEDIMYDSTVNYAYFNFFPAFNFRYKRNRMSSISFDYHGRSQQPQLYQIQPVRNNDDPLNIAIGNPDLKQSFQHQFRLYYNNYKVLTSQSVNVNASFNMTQNAIAMKQNIDLSGRRTYQYVNVDGNYNFWFWGGFGKKIVGDLRGYVSANVSYDHTNNFINNVANTNNTWRFSPNLNINYYKDTTFSIDYSFSPTYNSTVSAIRTDIRTKYWNFSQSLNMSYQLPFRFKIGTEVDWHIRQQLSADDQHNKVFIWNAWVSRSFLKDRSLVFKIYANDILNQNIGYRRINTADQIAESNYNTIQRYLMFSLTWNFTHTGGKSAEAESAIEIN